MDGRIKAARCGRSVGWEMSANSNMRRTLRRYSAICHSRQATVLSQFSTPCGGQNEPQRRFPHPSRSHPLDPRAQGKILSRAGPQSRSESRRSPRRPRREAARSAAAVRRALPQRGSSTIAPAAPWSRRVWYAGCGRPGRCEPISVISSGTASRATDHRVNSSMLPAMMRMAGLLWSDARGIGIISVSSFHRTMPANWKACGVLPAN